MEVWKSKEETRMKRTVVIGSGWGFVRERGDRRKTRCI